MTAGAGANLNQQFGMPIWVGVFLCTALTIFVSLLDFKKIPSVWMSVINYFSVCVMSAIAMAFVMGGSIFKIDEAEKSGAWGGFMVGVIFFITTLILFANSDKTARSDVPMLAIAKEVNPIFATTLRLCDFWFDFQYRL